VQAVDAADAGGDGLAMLTRSIGATAAAVDAARLGTVQRALAVDRLAEAVEDAAEQLVASTDARGGGDVFDAVAARDAGDGERGMRSVRPCLKPITSAIERLPPKL
jgi:hypothetical protein